MGWGGKRASGSTEPLAGRQLSPTQQLSDWGLFFSKKAVDIEKATSSGHLALYLDFSPPESLKNGKGPESCPGVY